MTNDKEHEAYRSFVDYTGFLTIMPFADHPELCNAACDFFDRWLELADERAAHKENKP